MQQGRAGAYSMLDLLDMRRPFHASTFYNATFLYGLDFAAVGLTNLQGAQLQEIVADPQPRRYRKVTLYNGIPVGMLALGDRREALAFKRAIDHGISLTPIATSLFADVFSINNWLDRQGVPSPIMGVSKMISSTDNSCTRTSMTCCGIIAIVPSASRRSMVAQSR